MLEEEIDGIEENDKVQENPREMQIRTHDVHVILNQDHLIDGEQSCRE